MKTLVIIPARSGSKGLKDKNIKLLNGKPLLTYTIEIAKKVFPNQDICVSTDSENYKKIAEKSGIEVPFLRPKELAKDTTTSQDVILHSLSYYNSIGIEYDTVLLLQPTSPFRLKKHLQEIIQTYSKNLEMIVSVTETSSNPYYLLVEENDQGYLEKSKTGTFTRRQDCPKVYEYNGSMYLIDVKSVKSKLIQDFTKVKKYEMDKLHSIDIDNSIDFKYAEFLLKEGLLD